MQVFSNHSLLQWNTFHLDAKAKVFAEYDDIDELRSLLRQYSNLPMLHIGRGSNLLFTADFPGIVLHSRICFIKTLSCTDKQVILQVGSGVVFDDMIAHCVAKGWGGAENLSYIPGEVGASAVQNIGAYGAETKDIIRRVHAMEITTLQERIFSREECRYGYRDSIFKNELKGQYIITSVEFCLSPQPVLSLDYGNLKEALSAISKPTIADVRNAVTNIRKQKLPEVEELGSAGSFFKNPVVSKQQAEILKGQYPSIPHYPAPNGVKIPAAWLIEQCGYKGKQQGGAKVYEKQPLVIVNSGNATAQDIVTLAEMIVRSVKEKFGIDISPEVNYI